MHDGNHDPEDWPQKLRQALHPTMNPAVDEYGNAVEGHDYADGQYNDIDIHPANGMQSQLEYSPVQFFDVGPVGFVHAATSMPMRYAGPGSQSDNYNAFHSYGHRPQANANMFEDATALQALQALQSHPQAQVSSGSDQSTEASPGVPLGVAPEPPASSERRTSNGKRPLCANEAPRTSSYQTTTLSAAENDNGPSPLGGGPTSRQHIVPARPKPGRKPATDEPPSKRKAQNRQSQRNFRARKAKTVDDLKVELTQAIQNHNVMRDQYEIKTAQLREHVRQLQGHVRHLQSDNAELKKMYESVPYTSQQGFHQFDPRQMRDARYDSPHGGSDHDTTPELGCEKCTRDHCACFDEMTSAMAFPSNASAPMDGVSMSSPLRRGSAETDDHKDFEELETDFTAKFSRSDESRVMDCGFCQGDKEVCICRDTSLGPAAKDEPTSSPNLAMTGPGSCADCQSNPKQRAWCQRVAQLPGEATPPSSRRSSLDVMEPKTSTRFELNAAASSPIGGPRTVGCSDTFKLLSGRVSTEPDAMATRHLKPVNQSFAQQDNRRDTFTMEPGMYSAMELDASSILTTLQHAVVPLQPRASDGGHARLVEEAEERRRGSSEDHAMLDAVSQYHIQG